MKCLLIPLLLLVTTTAIGQKKWDNVQKQIHALISNFHGEMGLFVKDLQSGKTIALKHCQLP